MLAVLMGFCLASAGSGCCLALTGQAFDPSDNGCKPAEAHPCLDGLKGLLWPWGRNREPSYSQFHPVPCSPALTPRSAFASGGELPGLVALPPPAPAGAADAAARRAMGGGAGTGENPRASGVASTSR